MVVGLRMFVSMYGMRQSGFSLLEIMITLSVASILIFVAIPGMNDMVKDNRRAGNINQLVSSMHLARSEAIKRGGTTISLCPSADGAACADADWDGGWILFINNDGDDPPVVDAGEEVLSYTQTSGGTTSLASTGTLSRGITFSSNGLAAQSGNLVYCDDRGEANAKKVTLSRAGRVKTLTWESGDDPCT